MVLSTYSDFQNKSASEKLGLVALEASKRLMGWSVYSGSVYQIDFIELVLISILESGTPYTEVGSIGAIVPGSFFLDKSASILYLQTSDSSNPNSKFLVSTVQFSLCNNTLHAPWDLDTGFDIEWLPMLKSTSDFGFEVDNDINQLGIAVESQGSISFHNDKDFWVSRINSWFFENQEVRIYSWHRDLPLSEKKLIFKGTVQGKDYAMDSVSFRLKDFTNELRGQITLNTYGSVLGDSFNYFSTADALTQAVASGDPEDLVGEIQFSTSLSPNLQRIVYGRPEIRAFNIDRASETGFKILNEGTVTLDSVDFTKVTGSVGSQFFHWYSPGDYIFIEDTQETRTIKEVTASNTLFVLATTPFTESFTGSEYRIKTSGFRDRMNRVWRINNHATNAFYRYRQSSGVFLTHIDDYTFVLDNISGIEVGDILWTQGLDDTIVNEPNSYPVVEKIFPSLNAIQINRKNIITTIGANGFRKVVLFSPIRKVTINGNEFPFLKESGNINSTQWFWNTNPDHTDIIFADTRLDQFTDNITGTMATTSGSRTVMGTNTNFTGQLSTATDTVIIGTASGRVVQIVSDTEMVVEFAASATTGSLSGTYTRVTQSLKDATVSVICKGRMDGDDPDLSTEFQNGPEIVEHILETYAPDLDLDTPSFTLAKDLAPESIGFAIPENFNERKAMPIRTAINSISRSILSFVSQAQNNQVKIEILRPNRISSIKSFLDEDILKFDSQFDLSNVSSAVTYNYNRKEYDFQAQQESFSIVNKVSEIGTYLSKSSKTYSIESLILDPDDAERYANRIAFILELGRLLFKIETKLQGATVELNESVFVNQSFMFNNFGLDTPSLVGSAISAKRDVFSSNLEIESLGNFMARCGVWSDSGHPDFTSSTDFEKLFSGYWTDQYGLISGDNFGINNWW